MILVVLNHSFKYLVSGLGTKLGSEKRGIAGGPTGMTVITMIQQNRRIIHFSLTPRDEVLNRVRFLFQLEKLEPWKEISALRKTETSEFKILFCPFCSIAQQMWSVDFFFEMDFVFEDYAECIVRKKTQNIQTEAK